MMKMFDVQSIEINASFENVFRYISNPKMLLEWTNAFESVDGKKAVMSSPNGEVQVELEVKSSKNNGTVDWLMTFPDKSVASAYSRIVKINDKNVHTALC